MTKENQKKLYNHFIATKQKARAAELLKVYPDFAEEKEESSEVIPEEKPKGRLKREL